MLPPPPPILSSYEFPALSNVASHVASQVAHLKPRDLLSLPRALALTGLVSVLPVEQFKEAVGKLDPSIANAVQLAQL